MGRLESKDVSPLFPKGLSIQVKASLFVLLSLTLMFVDQHFGVLRPLRVGLQALSWPVEALAQVPQGLNRLAYNLASRSAILRQNEALQRENLLLSMRLQKLVALEAENRRIRNLLQSARRLDERMLIAEIVATSPDPYRHYLKLNKGSVDGVFIGQALIDAHGIMGQITEVYPLTSVALLITDPNHGIPVEIARNGLRTIAHGEGGGSLSLPYLPSNADIKSGDQLISSGLGGRFPAGYPVGTVTAISHQAGEHFLSISATPAAHMDRGREVLLVWQAQEPAAFSATPPT
ncbi:MAG TPA: rod shape-determining protein MreC, partial [Nevskiales bacterium]|nr:rod shape-determining protein MreC [Nevskiales bacterium]